MLSLYYLLYIKEVNKEHVDVTIVNLSYTLLIVSQ